MNPFNNPYPHHDLEIRRAQYIHHHIEATRPLIRALVEIQSMANVQFTRKDDQLDVTYIYTPTLQMARAKILQAISLVECELKIQFNIPPET